MEPSGVEDHSSAALTRADWEAGEAGVQGGLSNWYHLLSAGQCSIDTCRDSVDRTVVLIHAVGHQGVVKEV